MRSDPASGTRIVLQAERDPAQVAVLSGGGAGHEPAHAGFVGPACSAAPSPATCSPRRGWKRCWPRSAPAPPRAGCCW
nr:dihydroxyacetone kinase subunit DhaK [Xanthomonas hyacinthi]